MDFDRCRSIVVATILSMKLLAASLLAAASVSVFPFQSTPLASDTHDFGKGTGSLSLIVRPVSDESSAPLGATRIPMLDIYAWASCEADVKIEELGLLHVGAGKPADLSGVYLADDGRRLSRVVTFNANGEAWVRPQALMIKKCDAVKLGVFADISPSASPTGEHGISLALADRVISSAKIVSVTRSDERSVITTAARQSGVITAHFLPLQGGYLRYGRRETVARLQLSADGKANHLLKKITLTNLENARDMQLVDFIIETRDGKTLTRVAQRMQGKKVTLTFDPTYILRRNQTVMLLVKAEMRASANTKARFTLEEEADLEAKEYQGR